MIAGYLKTTAALVLECSVIFLLGMALLVMWSPS
jgi:hypothetical protein